jgi:hypothetical protein
MFVTPSITYPAHIDKKPTGSAKTALPSAAICDWACRLSLSLTTSPRSFPTAMRTSALQGLQRMSRQCNVLPLCPRYYPPSSSPTKLKVIGNRSELFRYKVNMYRLREERDIEPETMANLVSSTLYERRFGPYFVSPIIAGFNQRTEKPFICGFDSIGCVLPYSTDEGKWG